MPLRLPRLTLFTGPNCSLCKTAKAELAKVRQLYPFELETIDIHSEKGAPWKNQYAWWIPALHLEDKEIAKGRWDEKVVRENLDACLFYVDYCGVTMEELAWLAGRGGGYVYDRNHLSVLGADEDVESTDLIDDRSRCFNCGSPDHMVSACTQPLNSSLIALSREIYKFFRKTDGGPERLHEHEERKAARLRLCDAFDPGTIRGALLRDALGLVGASGDQENHPWYERMLKWGYPPGWVSAEDPRLKIRAHIEGGAFLLDDTDAVSIIDSSSSPTSDDTGSVVNDSYAGSDTSSATLGVQNSKRWVHYPTTLFSSDILPAYSGRPLPPITPSDSTFTSERRALWDRIVNGMETSSSGAVEDDHKESPPPWRQANAFSAFGPAGWQGYVNAIDNTPLSRNSRTPAELNDDDHISESDMDVSD